MPAARGAATVGEPSSQHPAQAPLAPGDRREATTKAAARASRDRGPATKSRSAPRFSPARRWSRLPCGRPTERRLIPKESHKPGLDRRGVIGIHLLLAAAAPWKRRGCQPSPVSSGHRGHLTAPQRPADSTGGVAGWFAPGKKKPAGAARAPLPGSIRSIGGRGGTRIRAPRRGSRTVPSARGHRGRGSARCRRCDSGR